MGLIRDLITPRILQNFSFFASGSDPENLHTRSASHRHLSMTDLYVGQRHTSTQIAKFQRISETQPMPMDPMQQSQKRVERENESGTCTTATCPSATIVSVWRGTLAPTLNGGASGLIHFAQFPLFPLCFGTSGARM